jgi:hypothetical protein
MYMKNIKILLSMLLASLCLISACQDDEYELGRMLDKSEIHFRVEQDLTTDPGGNTVILINETPETVPMWNYGTGRSNRQVDTVRFAFKGEYEIRFSALTAGGIVEMDPVTIQVTEDNLMYVDDPLWTLLTGGVGEEKTWLLDLDAEGNTKYFDSPLYFSGNGIGWEGECVVEGGECWIWEAVWKDNQWIAEAGDFGTMTFSLEGGPFVTVDHKLTTGRGTESGTYFLDADNRTLSLTDVVPLQNSWADNDVAAWSKGKIISMTEHSMQLAYEHNAKEEFVILNYISQEYSDNWVAEPEGPEEDPNFDHGNQGELLAVDRTTTKTWKLDLEVPFNWTDLSGEFLNDWNSRSDYPDWAGYNDAAVENIDEASISFSEDGTVVVTQDDGTTEQGTYSIDEATNMITFTGIVPHIPIAGWVTATTSEENQWKIVRVERNDMDQVTGIWFGARDPEKAEYMVFHFKLQSGGSSDQLTPEEQMTKALTGDHTGTGARTFKIDTEWPVDWTDLEGENGWTQPGEKADWYWDEATEASVRDQRLSFSLENGELTATKLDAEGNTSSSPVQLDAENKLLTIPDTDIIQFGGAGEWLPTAGPEYKWVRGSFAKVAEEGFWLGVKTPDKDEYTIYHYVLE